MATDQYSLVDRILTNFAINVSDADRRRISQEKESLEIQTTLLVFTRIAIAIFGSSVSCLLLKRSYNEVFLLIRFATAGGVFTAASSHANVLRAHKLKVAGTFG